MKWVNAMNKKIKNDKLELPQTGGLNDQDYLILTLSQLKDMEKNLCIALTEASNEKLYKVIKDMFDEIANLQRKTYELAFKFGWYQLETQEEKKIQEKLKMLTNEFESLNN